MQRVQDLLQQGADPKFEYSYNVRHMSFCMFGVVGEHALVWFYDLLMIHVHCEVQVFFHYVYYYQITKSVTYLTLYYD